MKNQLSPFICNNRENGQEVEKILQQMNFNNSFMWQYERNGVINKLRLKFKLIPFIHEPRLDIERYDNQSEWLENNLIDVEKTLIDLKE